MRRDDVLNYLVLYLREFLYHMKFASELINIIAGSGYETAFFRIFVARLRLLALLKTDAVKHKEFEHLKNCELYSFHVSGKGFNIRILYSFLPDGCPVLLLAFYEREGKSKTDYTDFIEPALSRFNEMKEGYKNEY